MGQTNVHASLMIVIPPGGFTFDTIALVPACGTTVSVTSGGNCPAASADPGVFQIGPTAIGTGGQCAGRLFTVAITDVTTGQVTFTPAGGTVRPTAAPTCGIDFTFTVLKQPTRNAGVAGPTSVQTSPIGFASGSSQLPKPLGGSVPGSGAVSAPYLTSVIPLLTTTAVAAAKLGAPIADTATLFTSDPPGPAPTGTIDFMLFHGPACTGTPVFASTVPVSAGAGSYSSPSFIPTSSGTYRWVASYSGDANNAATATACGAGGGVSNVFRVAGNYIGDGRTDVAVYRPSQGAWYIQGRPGTTVWGAAGDIPVPADYDGDGRTDVAAYRPSQGGWYIQGQGQGGTTPWGAAGDIPVPADYDGDGRTDVAVYRPSEGRWYIRGQAGTDWGAPGDIPVPGDYDGDGTTDVAVYRPSTGGWYIHGQAGAFWGVPEVIPVPGDYNGDGRTDIAVYLPSNGVWYVQGQGATTYGDPGAMPVPGDYNGDGTTDVALYQPYAGAWYIHGQGGTFWGAFGDLPLPLPAAIRQFFP